MEHNRKHKILMLIALFVAITSLSVGFAAFSTTLSISSSASVSPSDADFSVKFSNMPGIVQSGEVLPSNYSKGVEATSGIIDNSGMPKLKNLSAIFTTPGQYVDYSFVVANAGKYDAFLNSINFIGDKKCVGAENATDSLVQIACNSINVTVSIGGTEYSETTAISGKKLSTNNYEEVKVKLSYDINGGYADGGFSVLFPDIAFVYSTVDDPSMEPVEPVLSQKPELVSGDLNTPGSEVALGSELFYVLGQENGNVKLLSKYNLYVGNYVNEFGEESVITDATGIQGTRKAYGYIGCPPAAGGVAFGMNSDYENSNIISYVNHYENYLKSEGFNLASVRLATKDELIDLGCTSTTCEPNGTGELAWLYSTTYWTATSVSESTVCYVDGYNGSLSGMSVTNDYMAGVRPVIEIPLSEF